MTARKKKVEIPGVKILGKIGEGSQGIVLKGVMEEDDTPVAVKILSPRLAKVSEFRQRFAREMGVAADMDHPNFIHFISSGKLGNSFYYVMEYAPGTDLNTLLTKLGPLPEKKALHLAIQAADALGYAHEHGLVHRDIKPDNIIVSRQWKMKILDLGLAKDNTAGVDLTMAGTIFGTANYISPEAIEDSSAVDARSDIYSLGATLFKMLTGRPPFEGVTPTLIMEKVLHSIPDSVRELRPDLSTGIETIVRVMLEKDKEDRYASAGHLHKDLVRLYKGEKPKGVPKVDRPKPVRKKDAKKGKGGSQGFFGKLLSLFGLGRGKS